MQTEAPPFTLSFAALPAIDEQLDGGTFAGITNQPGGTYAAVVLLPEKAKAVTWQQAKDWAEKLGGQLPTRLAAFLLFTNLKDQLDPRWHWTREEFDASFAWGCGFGYGTQNFSHKSFEGCAVAVRLIPIAA